jgi:hypothetical protein
VSPTQVFPCQSVPLSGLLSILDTHFVVGMITCVTAPISDASRVRGQTVRIALVQKGTDTNEGGQYGISQPTARAVGGGSTL